MISTSSNL